MDYRTVTKEGNSLVEVKRSKFIGIIRPVSSVTEAADILHGEKKKYHDAKHHCSAYIIRGENGAPDIVHSSDDGEPSGTAGAPILEVLSGAGLKDVVLVVTRYFGGTLLGTGGLVRAYTDAAKAALEDAGVSEMVLMQQFTAVFDYSFTGSMDHYLQNHGITKLDAVYTDKVEYRLACPGEGFDSIKKELVDLTGSSIIINKGEVVYTPAQP
ncbi:MAG: YigZ family protein [Lachnospiraceae bacterium]|nr:YigZ family protein [Lachnospiraceae bacterium]